MRMREAWRILRVKNGRPHTLFHGFYGSRELPTDRVLRAVERIVHNSGKKEKFLSGWHVLPTKEECLEYLTRFKDHSDLVVCRVWIAIPRAKPNSRVTLCRFLKIRAVDWAKAKKEFNQ